MADAATSGIRTSTNGQSVVPSSKRADGTTRKEIKIRPGYRPPEDVEKYKSRNAEAWRSRGGPFVPGVESSPAQPADSDTKSKNAKRREAAKKKKELQDSQTDDLDDAANGLGNLKVRDDSIPSTEPAEGETIDPAEDAERQKKIRNSLKKLRAVRDLKSKKQAGEKLSADQLVKIAKEHEIVRDLVKLDYSGPELDQHFEPASDGA